MGENINYQPSRFLSQVVSSSDEETGSGSEYESEYESDYENDNSEHAYKERIMNNQSMFTENNNKYESSIYPTQNQNLYPTINSSIEQNKFSPKKVFDRMIGNQLKIEKKEQKVEILETKHDFIAAVVSESYPSIGYSVKDYDHYKNKMTYKNNYVMNGVVMIMSYHFIVSKTPMELQKLSNGGVVKIDLPASLRYQNGVIKGMMNRINKFDKMPKNTYIVKEDSQLLDILKNCGNNVRYAVSEIIIKSGSNSFPFTIAASFHNTSESEYIGETRCDVVLHSFPFSGATTINKTIPISCSTQNDMKNNFLLKLLTTEKLGELFRYDKSSNGYHFHINSDIGSNLYNLICTQNISGMSKCLQSNLGKSKIDRRTWMHKVGGETLISDLMKMHTDVPHQKDSPFCIYLKRVDGTVVDWVSGKKTSTDNFKGQVTLEVVFKYTMYV